MTDIFPLLAVLLLPLLLTIGVLLAATVFAVFEEWARHH